MANSSFNLLLLLTAWVISTDIAVASPCDDFKGEAYGLCLAAEAIPCNADTTDNIACKALAEDFARVTETVPPWLYQVGMICPCRLEMDQVFSEIESRSLSLEGKCLVGQLTENVPVPDSIGIQITGKIADSSGTVLMGAYSYDDTDPAGGQCEVDASIEPLGHIFTALIISEAEQQVCADAIRQMALTIEIDCLEP